MKSEDMNKSFGDSNINRQLLEDMPCAICTKNITDDEMEELADYVEETLRQEYPDIADEMFRLWEKGDYTDEEYDYLYDECDKVNARWFQLIEEYAIHELGATYYEDSF